MASSSASPSEEMQQKLAKRRCATQPTDDQDAAADAGLSGTSLRSHSESDVGPTRVNESPAKFSRPTGKFTPSRQVITPSKLTPQARSGIRSTFDTTLSPNGYDDVLRKEVENLLVKVVRAEKPHTVHTPRKSQSLSYAAGKVSRHAAAIEMARGIEKIRNFLELSLADQEVTGRQQFLALFGGDCRRIARTHVLLDTVRQTHDDAIGCSPRDDKTMNCLKACESVESLLSDLGLGAQLRKAYDLELAKLYKRTHDEDDDSPARDSATAEIENLSMLDVELEPAPDAEDMKAETKDVEFAEPSSSGEVASGDTASSSEVATHGNSAASGGASGSGSTATPGSAADEEVRKVVSWDASYPNRVWVYEPCNKAELVIRHGPSIDAARTREKLRIGEKFEVDKELVHEDVTFLKLADGRGWVFNHKPGLGEMCKRIEPTHDHGSEQAVNGKRVSAQRPAEEGQAPAQGTELEGEQVAGETPPQSTEVAALGILATVLLLL